MKPLNFYQQNIHISYYLCEKYIYYASSIPYYGSYYDTNYKIYKFPNEKRLISVSDQG